MADINIIDTDTSVELNFIHKRGDNFYYALTITNDDGSYYDFTNYTARMQLKELPRNKNYVLEITTQGIEDKIALSEGLIEIILDSSNFKNLSAKRYFYDIELNDINNKTKTWFTGKFTLNQDTTR